MAEASGLISRHMPVKMVWEELYTMSKKQTNWQPYYILSKQLNLSPLLVSVDYICICTHLPTMGMAGSI